MSPIFRRILYLSFFLFFLIFSVIFISYSIGYRYNFSSKSLEKNGAFYIKSFPRNAEIWLDDNKTRDRTPNQLIDLRPGLHKISVEKENYISWHKTLEAIPGETTFAEEISLFFEDRPKTSLGQGSSQYLINKNHDRYAYFVGHDLWIVNTDSAKAFQIYTFTNEVELIDWSPDDQKILIKEKDKYQIFSTNQLTLEPLDLPITSQLLWDNRDANFIWYLDDGKLSRHNLTLGTETIKFSDVNSFSLSGEYLAVQIKNDTNSTVIQYHKESDQEIRRLDNINLGKIELFLADSDYLIFTAGSKIYIKSPNKELVEFPASLVKIYGRYLLISDSHEIWLYDYHDNWKEILDRSSAIVADVTWHPNGSYFIDEINGQTTLYELDGRDYRNNILLLENPLKKMYLFNHDGSKLFILTPEENFYLQIQ